MNENQEKQKASTFGLALETERCRKRLLELLHPAEVESMSVGSILRSPEHEALIILCELFRNGQAEGVKQVLAPLADVALKLKESSEIVDEVTAILNSPNFSIVKEGTMDEVPLTFEQTQSEKLALISSILP